MRRLPGQVRVIAFDLVGTLIYPSPGVVETYFRAVGRLARR